MRIPNELNHWAAHLPRQDEEHAGHYRRRHGSGKRRSDAQRHGQSRGRLELRHPAATRSTIRSTTPSASASSRRSTRTLNQYHVILEVAPQFQTGPEALSGIYVNSSSGQQVPLSTLVDSSITAAPLVINHQGLFPSVTISFNLKPGVALGDAVDAIQQASRSRAASPCRSRRLSRATPAHSSRRCRASRS